VQTLAAVHHDPNLISTFQAIVLGILQGATELFPVSSLGHTVLFPSLFGWHNIVKWQSQPESPWLAFVVMLHVGSAVGLLIYFWRDWIAIIGAFFRTLGKRKIETSTERLAWLIVVATIPVGILGIVLEHPVRTALAKPLSAAIFLVVNGVILLSAERFRRRAEVRELAAREGMKADGGRRLDTLEFREAGVIGVAQSSALIAGISRDGVCMTAGLVRGLDNSDAARYAFLLATPPILAAGLYKVSDLTGKLGNGVRGAAVVAAVFAAATAIVTVHFLTRYFKTNNLTPFGIYCIVFGLAMVIYNA
jgi:undecaprenyl-diphosphatase